MSESLQQIIISSDTFTPKPFAFVLMPFAKDFDDVYKLGIRPACENSGYYCERLDDQIFNEETMLQRIYNQISKADLIISDMTERNANVFYETGYAHALGKRVVLLTKNKNDIPFDLQHYHHIIYSDGIVHLKEKLEERLTYYSKNYQSTTLNPFCLIKIYLNDIELNIFKENIIPFFYRQIFRGRESIQYLRLKFSLHVLDNSPENQFSFQIRLITPDIFRISGYYSSSSSFIQYETVAMGDKQLLHKPMSSLDISKNDPDSITFDLEKPSGSFENGRAQLRLISNGLCQNIGINLTSNSHR